MTTKQEYSILLYLEFVIFDFSVGNMSLL